VTTSILALEKDLFFAVKIRDTLSHHEMEAKTVRTLAALTQALTSSTENKPELVIINIAIQGVDWEEAIRQARAQGYPVLCFGSHMDLEARSKALAAGALRVVANSKFASDMPGLVKRMISAQPMDTANETDEDEN